MKLERRISDKTLAEYEAYIKDGEYSIKVTEYDNEGNISDLCQVDCITADKNRARELLEVIADMTVCACTLCDVIIDLIC